MSSAFPTTPRRGTQRASHLRQVSNGSSDSMSASRPATSASSTGTVQHDPAPLKIPVETRCTLWIHDESLSKEEVLLNLDLFPDVKAGELMAIIALKTDSGLRDLQEKTQPIRKDSDCLTVPVQRATSGSSPKVLDSNGTSSRHDLDFGKRYLFIAKDMPKDLKLRQPGLEISVYKHIADAFSLKHRSSVLLSTTHPDGSSASHVEMSFKDEYLARSDMWRLVVGELSNKTVYKGQKILFMGTIKAQVTAVYVDGSKVQSAFFSTDTKPIFRSESARYVIFVQMSKEMWDFDSEGSGEIMFNKVVNGFLPTLFKKWVAMKAKHLVSIVLFTRVEYEKGLSSELAISSHDSAYHTGVQADGNKRPYKDFYRVVVNEMASGEWTTILYQLKREFKFFRRDISMHRIDTINALTPPAPDSSSKITLGTRMEAEPSLAMHGNVLEAIDLASSQFSHDYIDRDLVRTGISIIVITPCAGLFEVDHETLRTTTEILIGNGIGIDLVCLPKMPLHSVPLFRYRNPQYAAFQEAQNLKSLGSENSTPRQAAPIFGSFSSLNSSLSPPKALHTDRTPRHGSFTSDNPPDEWSYAIPHWIDVSFWTGASQDFLGTEPLSKTSISYFKRKDKHGLSDFEVRCKMYEMEMATIMDIGMTEIMVLPLQDDPLFTKILGESREACSTLEGQKRATTEYLERDKLYASLVEFVNGPSKSLHDRHSTKAEKEFVKALETFDLNKSEIFNDLPGLKQKTEARRLFKPSSEEGVKKALAEDQKIFGTSFIEDIIPKGMSLLLPSPGRNKPSVGSIEDIVRPRKSSVSSTMTSTPKASPIKPPKFGRQISLGKHGFGIAAPKAVTAEIHIENASAMTTGPSKMIDSNKNIPNTRANHLLGNYNTPERPTSAQSEGSKMRQDLKSLEDKSSNETPESPLIRPITIKSAVQSLDSTNQFKSRSVLGSVYESEKGTTEESRTLPALKAGDTQKVFNSKLLAGAVPELPAVLSPTTALSPWLSVLNPSNPTAHDIILPSQYRRWQHLFPKPIRLKTMKWKSLCSPASVPLTTEYFPTKRQLDTEYEQKPYNISRNAEDDLNEVPKSREEFLRELVGLRLSAGFQIVIGPAVAEAFGQKSLKIINIFDRDRIAEDGSSVFMSMGNIIHQLSCVNGTEVEVNTFIRKPTAAVATTPDGSAIPSVYYPAVRTVLADQYLSRKMHLGKPKSEYKWNYVDSFLAGFDEEMTETLRFWRARFVLIPTERPGQYQRPRGEDSEEEIRLEGIRKLTQIWQRHRYIPVSERRFQSLASKKTKDPNPLDIVYKTDDPSVVVTAELETLPIVETGEAATRRGQLLETQRFRKTKLDIAALAEAIQAPVEKGGVRMQNRRWHFRLHYNCFIGSDMTTWLLENFDDLEDREDAVELGNMLMLKDEQQRQVARNEGKEKDKDIGGIFVHVEKRHPFRDGQYFYQVTGEYAKQRPESRSGWFGSRRRGDSIPSTPLSENLPRDAPQLERISSSHQDDLSSESGMQTPTTTGTNSKMPKVALSKVMKYDVDHRKRSYRPERINLHYDRLHNPDNCYHIRIDWMSVTAKLIEDAIDTWAATAERYGLRLVEVPIGETCSITDIHPFRAPYAINLALPPPDQQPRTYFDASSFAPQPQSVPASRHYYQKAIMKKFNFVLDIEAAKNFPSNVDVTYSWGRPDFKYTQYIHRSGVVLAEITDEGNFLVLANRLYNNRTAAAREMDRYIKIDHTERNNNRPGLNPITNTPGIAASQSSPFASPILHPSNNHAASPSIKPTVPTTSADVLGPSLLRSSLSTLTTPETVTNELETFCSSPALLSEFYKEVLEKSTSLPVATPPVFRSPYTGSLLDSYIPVLGLPPGVLKFDGSGNGGRERDMSPAPLRGSGAQSFGGMLGRRASVQVGALTREEGGGWKVNAANASGESPKGSIFDGDKGL